MDGSGSRGRSFGDVYATLFRHLGIDAQTTISDLNGRPQYLIEDQRMPIRELV